MSPSPRWPTPQDKNNDVAFTDFPPSIASSMPAIGSMPMELLVPILGSLSLASLLHLASTCRCLRSLILAPAFMDIILKEAIARGSLMWLLPVDAMPGGETARAYETIKLWSPKQDFDEQSTSDATPVLPILLPDFPRMQFIKACWESDSMMNRKRIWGQVKRFEVLYRDYRVNGWQVNVFADELGNELENAD